MEDESGLVARIAALQKEVRTKKTFLTACAGLSQICEQGDALPAGAVSALAEAGKVVFIALQTRFSNPKFWQAGLELFLALEFHLPSVSAAATWREAAMEEVDEDAREKAKDQARLRKLEEDKKHNKGRWSDANTPVTQAELLAASGMTLVDGSDERPGMSRDARNELRVKTVVEEDICVVCQEAMPVGSKAKSMPCGHLFHDECLLSWVKKSNSCPTCRYDEMQSEKMHFDDVQRMVQQSDPGAGGLYS